MIHWLVAFYDFHAALFSPAVYYQKRPATYFWVATHQLRNHLYNASVTAQYFSLQRTAELRLMSELDPRRSPLLIERQTFREKWGVELVNDGGDYGSIKQCSTETSSKGQGRCIDWLNIKLSKVCARVSLYASREMCTTEEGTKTILKIHRSSRNDCKHYHQIITHYAPDKTQNHFITIQYADYCT